MLVGTESYARALLVHFGCMTSDVCLDLLLGLEKRRLEKSPPYMLKVALNVKLGNN